VDELLHTLQKQAETEAKEKAKKDAARERINDAVQENNELSAAAAAAKAAALNPAVNAQDVDPDSPRHEDPLVNHVDLPVIPEDQEAEDVPHDAESDNELETDRAAEALEEARKQAATQQQQADRQFLGLRYGTLAVLPPQPLAPLPPPDAATAAEMQRREDEYWYGPEGKPTMVFNDKKEEDEDDEVDEWVQCENKECELWRVLPPSKHPADYEGHFVCDEEGQEWEDKPHCKVMRQVDIDALAAAAADEEEEDEHESLQDLDPIPEAKKRRMGAEL
jgi:hypothetical protein